jgi:hypothetical protein
MTNAKLQSIFLKNLNDNLEDILDRPIVPRLVRELQPKLPDVNTQTLEAIIATSFAMLDTIDAKK